MDRYEYFQETTESITDDSWQLLLDKHGSQGWELSSINLQNAYEMNLDQDSEVKHQEANKNVQTIYLVIFKRAY